MKTRIQLYSQVLAGTLASEAAAAQLGIGLADVQRGIEALEMARVMLEQDRVVRRRMWRRSLTVVGVLVGVAMTTYAVDPVWAQVTCVQTLPSPLVTFCPNDPAVASQVNGNFQTITGWMTGKTGPLASVDITTRDIAARNVSLTGPASWGTTGGQMLNLYQTGYGLGVQNSTLYSRTSGNFAWYLNGAHAPNTFDPGGGTILMTLNNGGDLSLPSNAWGSMGESGETTYSSAGTLTWNMCGGGTYVCGIGVGHQANNSQYWTGARIAVRCCTL